MSDLKELAIKARNASYEYAILDTKSKNKALNDIADNLEKHKQEIFDVNKIDVQNAIDNGLSEALTDRLTITPSRFDEMVTGVRKVATLNDPTGRIFDGRTLENGLTLYKKSVPLGVVGVIYESRPNVTVDIATLCLKSGNASFLRGGSEAIKTNTYLHKLIKESLVLNNLNPDGVTLIEDTDRALVKEMLSLNDYIDVLIPRGGEKLQRMCQTESSIPVIIGGFGVSHIFVDETANLEKAIEIILNAKTQKPSACNSLDTLLVHKKISKTFIPMLLKSIESKKISIVTHKDAVELCKDYPYAKEGVDDDFNTEFLSLKINVTVIDSVYDAIAHMRKYHASHSDAILTDSQKNAKLFVNAAGSACVYVNASTRFSDGGQFGLGAEVAISTQKLHARGPMALDALTTYQYVCQGDYLSRS